MNEKPFNPAVAPELTIPAGETQSAKAGASRRKRKARTRARPENARRKSGSNPSAFRLARKFGRKTKASWKRVKRDLESRLARLDAEQLKRVLVACGVAAAAALIIIALAKHAALVTLLLAVFGAALVLRLWQQTVTLRI